MTVHLRSSEDVIDWLCEGREPAQASISIAKLSAVISRALVTDGLDHDTGEVLQILLEPLGETADRPDGSIDAGAIFLHGSDWFVGLAEHFGCRGERGGFVDLDWLAGRPRTRAVYRALTMLSLDAMGAASDAYEQQYGHSMMEVFMASVESGEDFDQTQARLTAQHRGLRAVK